MHLFYYEYDMNLCPNQSELMRSQQGRNKSMFDLFAQKPIFCIVCEECLLPKISCLYNKVISFQVLSSYDRYLWTSEGTHYRNNVYKAALANVSNDQRRHYTNVSILLQQQCMDRYYTRYVDKRCFSNYSYHRLRLKLPTSF